VLHLRRAVQQLVGGHVRQHEADDFRRVEVRGHLNRILLEHADALRIGAQTVSAAIRSPSRSLVQPGPISSTTPTRS
jgi:hypothetical protein